MTANDVEFSFEDVDVAEAGDLVTDLTEYLVESLPTIETRRMRPDPRTQDLGIVLGVVLGSTPAAALASGVATWLMRRHDVRMVLRKRKPDGSTVAVTLQGRPNARTLAIITEFLR